MAIDLLEMMPFHRGENVQLFQRMYCKALISEFGLKNGARPQTGCDPGIDISIGSEETSEMLFKAGSLREV